YKLAGQGTCPLVPFLLVKTFFQQEHNFKTKTKKTHTSPVTALHRSQNFPHLSFYLYTPILQLFPPSNIQPSPQLTFPTIPNQIILISPHAILHSSIMKPYL